MTTIHHFGAIAASDWTDEFHHRKPIPAGCREVLRCEISKLPERARLAAERLIRQRPRVRKVIVVVNVRPLAPADNQTPNENGQS